MLDSFKCLTYPEKNLDYSTPSPVDNTNITNGSSSSESNSYLGLKTSREEQKSMESSRGDVPWTLEEEYLFFEAHKLLKNKWTKYPSYFPQFCKEMKEFKNHFHACIIKTVRRIVNNKYDYKIKDIMRAFYSCDYLIQMLNKMKHLTKMQIELLEKKKYKYNPKLLIKNQVLTHEIINKYCCELLNEYLLKKPVILSILAMLDIKTEEISVDNVMSLFTLIIKTKLIVDCQTFMEKGEVISPFEKTKKIEKYVYENSNPSINYLKIKEYFCI